MDSNRLRAIMTLHRDTQADLATSMGIEQSALSKRLAGIIDFRLAEVAHIAKRYDLEAKDVYEIFFADLVS